MLLIHTPLTSRTEYVFDLFFGSLIPVPYRLTADEVEFFGHDGPRLSYGDAPVVKDAVFVRSAPLLTERGVDEDLDPVAFAWKTTVGLFPLAYPGSAFSFDPFAAAFFLVSRYEEYGSTERDEHGRFLPRNSILYQQGFLRQPVVNVYASYVRDVLTARFPRFDWPRPAFSAISTIDVDVAYAYRGRSALRTLGATVRQLLTREEGSLGERVRVLAGRRPDPYDSFDWLGEVHARFGVPLLYFVLAGGGSRLDRNLPIDGPEMSHLVRRLAEDHPIGIHPSYRSNGSTEAVAEEIRALEGLTGKPVTRSRQHFLRLEVPGTYRALIDLGITEDYSMGYAAEAGFRAGIAHPFRFYDLEREQTTDLSVFPLAYMDGTLKVYQRLSPDEAETVITGLSDAVRAHGGLFMSLWHNNTVADYGPWAGWQRVFIHSLAAMTAG